MTDSRPRKRARTSSGARAATAHLEYDRYQALVEASAQIIWVANAAGEITEASPSWKAYTGQNDEQWRDGGWLDALHPEDRTRVTAWWPQAVAARKPASIEYRVRHVDGYWRWMDARAVPVFDADGRLREWVGMNADIDARRRAQEEARHAAQRFRLMAESIPQKIYTATGEGDVDYVNPQWMAFTGVRFEQITQSGWAQFVHPDDLAETVRLWQQSVATGAPLEMEHRFRRADGVYRWHVSRALPLRNEAGHLLMWVGSNTDIQAVKEADDRKNEFLAILAHELRNPLAPIRHLLEVVKRADGNNELVEPALLTMDRHLAHLVRLIDDLLDVSRIGRGKLSLRRKEIDLAAVIQQAVEASGPAMDAAGHQLSVSLPPQPLRLNADPVRLAQVFGNLLNNAAKFTPPGGRVWLSAQRQGDELVVSVRDSGIGITPKLLPTLFELFAQGKEPLDRAQGGLGIGLNLVQRLVRMHGGSVQALSEGPGRGSEFVVRLPATIGEIPAQKVIAPVDSRLAELGVGAARRILVVDDNRDAAEALAMLLQMNGHETRKAFDGLEAVEVAGSFKPELVLLDLGMPRLNGFEAARRIRELPGGEDIVLVALTGWGHEEDRRKTAAAGFDGHLVKPVGVEALMEVVAGLR